MNDKYRYINSELRTLDNNTKAPSFISSSCQVVYIGLNQYLSNEIFIMR